MTLINRALNTEELADCRKGIIVGLHRKMVPHESYFLCTEKFRPMLFGNPIVLPCSESTTYQDLYSCVWTQVSRLVTPLPPEGSGSAPGGSVNHAADCDDSLGYKYPFTLKVRPLSLFQNIANKPWPNQYRLPLNFATRHIKLKQVKYTALYEVLLILYAT